MRAIRLILLILLLGLLISCGGGNPFVPLVGPFDGEFMVGTTLSGAFSLTTGGGLIAGTGTLVHNNTDISVSISGVISDRQITGQVVNELQGSGSFNGAFNTDSSASGTFTFTDTLGLVTTVGTWAARTTYE
jgi:hypothetical protein